MTFKQHRRLITSSFYKLLVSAARKVSFIALFILQRAFYFRREHIFII